MFDINKAKEYASAHAYKELLTYFVSTSGLEKSEIAYIMKTDRSILGMCLKGTAKITDKMIANLLVYLKLPLPENINSNDILYNEDVAMKLATEHRYPELLSYYIKTSALSRKKIASLLECSRRSLMRYEEKNRKIPKEVIIKLLTLMDLSNDQCKKYQNVCSNTKNNNNKIITSTINEIVRNETKPSEDPKNQNRAIELDEKEIVEEEAVLDEIKENTSASADSSATVSESEPVKSNVSVNDETAEEEDTEADSVSQSSHVLSKNDANRYDITKDIDLASMFIKNKDGNARLIWHGNYTLYNSLYLMMNVNEWSKEKVAVDLKIDVNTLIDYMCGRKQIKKELIPMILIYFDVKIDTLFPELSSYDFGETYLRLEINNVIYKEQPYPYQRYYWHKSGELLGNAFSVPIEKYNGLGQYIKSCNIDELTMDEYYNINPYYIYNERKNPVEFKTELKLPKGYQIKKELCYFKDAELAFRRNYNQIITRALHKDLTPPQLEDKWNKNNTKTPSIATGFYVEVRYNNVITLRIYNQDNLRRRISLAKYYKSDSPLYQKLKDADYTKLGKLVFIGGSRPENQYIVWPDHQIISLAEENYEWFKEFDITFESYGAIGNVPVYIRKEEDENKKIAAANAAVSELLKNALPNLSESKSQDAKVSAEISESYEAEQIDSVTDKINKADYELNSESASESVLASEQKDSSTQTKATSKSGLNTNQETNNKMDLNAEGSDGETIENIQEINVKEDYEQFDPNDPESFHKEVTNCDGNLCLIWRGEKDTLRNTIYMYRRIREMSVETAAELLDIDPVQLMKLECGLLPIDNRTQRQIRVQLEIQFDDLFPELYSYNGSLTFIRLATKSVYIYGKKYNPIQFYCQPDGDLFIDLVEWPIARYSHFGKLIDRCLPHELSVDEFYNIPDEFLYDYDNDKEFKYDSPGIKLPRNYEITKAYYFGDKVINDELNNNRNYYSKFGYIKNVKVSSYNRRLTVDFINGESYSINVTQYTDSDSVWFEPLKKKSYLGQFQIKLIGGDAPENQYLVWPDGQIISIVENMHNWFYYYKASFISYGKCGMLITYSKK